MLAKHCLQEFKLDCQLRRLSDRTIKGYYNNTLAEFEAIKSFYKGMSGYYGKMKKWFLAKYPNYQDIDFSELAIAG